MSIKIYNVYKVEGMTIDQVMVCLRNLRETYHKECVTYMVRLQKMIEEDYPTFGSLRDKLREDAEKLESDIFSFGASVMVYFHEGNVYVQFFGFNFCREPNEYFDGKLVDYHYQDQSDAWYDFEYHEGKMTYHERWEASIEYKERERVWSEIFGESYRPNECGLVFEVYTKNDVTKVVADYYDSTKGE